MTRFFRMLTMLVLAPASLSLAGCSDPEPDVGGSTSVEDGLTPPGSDLMVGETATVPLAESGDVIELAVTAIDAGDPRDLADLEGVRGTPYYVRLEATAVAGDAQRFFPAGSVIAYADGRLVAPIATPLTVGACTREQFRTTPPIGTTLETCVTFVVEDGGAPVDRVAYYEGDYSYNDGTAVEWSEG